MNGISTKVLFAGVLAVQLYAVLSSPSRTGGSAFSGIYSALSSLVNRPKTFSATLLPPQDTERRHLEDMPAKLKPPGFFDKVISHNEKRKQELVEEVQFRPPALEVQFKESARDGVQFRKPVMEKIDQASAVTVKRSAQLDLPDYSNNPASNRLVFPGEPFRSSNMDVIYPSDLVDSTDDTVEVLDQLNELENFDEEKNNMNDDGENLQKDIEGIDYLENPPREKRHKGNLVFTQNNKALTGLEALEALNEFLESDEGAKLLEKASKEAAIQDRKDSFRDSSTPRSISVQSHSRTVTAAPLILSSTPGSFRLIQPIQILPASDPRSNHLESFSHPTPAAHPLDSEFDHSSPRLKTSSSLKSFLSPHLAKPRQSKNQPPALTFVDNGLVAVLGRQVAAGKGKPVEGFPNGLPDLTPLGVRITLENMFGPNGEMIMNPIPGEAGVDYPTFNSVPDTDFSCSNQQYPGIFTDTAANCQAFYMCQPNGESTAFLCPNGTMFNQQYFVCDWWYNLDCAEQPKFFSLNQLIYETPAEEGKVCKSLFCKDD